MFKTALVTSAALSLVGCLAYDIHARMQLADIERQIAMRQAVQHRNTAMQQRLDLINDLQDVRNTTDDAVKMLNALQSQATTVESVSVIGAKKVVIRGRAESQKLVEAVAKQLGVKVTFEANR